MKRLVLAEIFSDDYLRIVTRYRNTIQKLLNEYDIIVFMARKAICFYNAMLSNGEIHQANCHVISSRVLDYNTVENYRGKKIAVVDDVVVKGASLKKIAEKLTNNRIEADFFVAACEQSFPQSLSEDKIELNPSFSYFEKSKIYDFVGLITKYIEVSMCPFNIDQPLFKVEKDCEKLKILLNEYNAVDISSGLQQKYNITNQVIYFNYSPSKEGCLISKILEKSVIKIRFMFNSHSSIVIPFVLFPELSIEELNNAFNYIASDYNRDFIWDANKRIENENRLKVINYCFSEILLLSFFSQKELDYSKIRNNDIVQFDKSSNHLYDFEDLSNSIIYKLLKKIKVEGADCSKFLFPKYVGEFYKIISKYNANDFGYEDANGEVVGSNPVDAEDKLSSVVFSITDICSNLPVEKKTMNSTYYISSVIDVMIDRGIIVPSIVHKKNRLIRAYKMGEYSKLTREQVCSFAEMLRLYQKKTNQNIAKTEFEKLCVLFFHGAISWAPPLFKEQTEFEKDCYGIGYSLYGPRVSTTETAYAVDSDSALITDFTRDEIVEYKGESGHKGYIIKYSPKINDNRLRLYCSIFADEMYAVKEVFDKYKYINDGTQYYNLWEKYVHTHIQYLTLAAIGGNRTNQFLSLCAELYIIMQLNEIVFDSETSKPDSTRMSRLLSGIDSGLWKYVCFKEKYLERTELKLIKRSEHTKRAIMMRPYEGDSNPAFEQIIDKCGSILFRTAFFISTAIKAKKSPADFVLKSDRTDNVLKKRPKRISNFGQHYDEFFQKECSDIEKEIAQKVGTSNFEEWLNKGLAEYKNEAQSVLDLCDLFLINKENPNHLYLKRLLILYSKDSELPKEIKGCNLLCFQGISHEKKCQVFKIPDKNVEESFFTNIFDSTFNIQSVKYIMLNMDNNHEGAVQVADQVKGSFLSDFLKKLLKGIEDNVTYPTKELYIISKSLCEKPDNAKYKFIPTKTENINSNYIKESYALEILKTESNTTNIFNGSVGAVDSIINGGIKNNE